jgi:thiol-disulfide isomerase/thioredoxin
MREPFATPKFCDHSAMQSSDPLSTPALLVACLCAEWCGTCRDYQAPFMQLQSEFPSAHFRWIDVEDQSDLVDPIEVEDFPTVLIATGGQGRFFGTVTPHIDTLRRLIQTALLGGPRSLADAGVVDALVARLAR